MKRGSLVYVVKDDNDEVQNSRVHMWTLTGHNSPGKVVVTIESFEPLVYCGLFSTLIEFMNLHGSLTEEEVECIIEWLELRQSVHRTTKYHVFSRLSGQIVFESINGLDNYGIHLEEVMA